VNFYSGFLDSTYQGKVTRFLYRHKTEMDSMNAVHAPQYAINEYLSRKYPQESDSLRAPLSLVLDHIDYIVKLIGADHVGLGSDFDGVSGATPSGIDSAADLPKITQGLLDRGYSAEDIHKILGGNVLRVFREVERVSREMQKP
jgi:membrane dipeptidase